MILVSVYKNTNLFKCNFYKMKIIAILSAVRQLADKVEKSD